MEKIEINGDIGKTLRRYRRERGITQEEIASAIGMTAATISVYENGCQLPEADTVNLMMEIMSKKKPLIEKFEYWLAAELKKRQLSKRWLARQLGVCDKTIQRYLNGESNPFPRTRAAIERVFHEFDADPNAWMSREEETRKRKRKKASNGKDLEKPETGKRLVNTAIYPEAIVSIRRRIQVGNRVIIPVRSLDPESGGALTVTRREAVTVCGVYPYVAVFRRKNGMKESYTWQELVGMGV